jgi:hypothetical protein
MVDTSDAKLFVQLGVRNACPTAEPAAGQLAGSTGGFGIAEIYKVVSNINQALHRESDLFALL